MKIDKQQVLESFIAILGRGILRIRNAAELSRAHLEATHIHNIPELLRVQSDDLILYYYQGQRLNLLAGLSGEERAWAEVGFEEPWRVIEDYLIQVGKNPHE